MIIFLYGADTYRSRANLKKLKEKFVKEKDKQGLNISLIPGSDLTLQQFRKTCLTGGLFSSKRLTIVENFLTKTSPRETIFSLIDFIQQPQDKNNIIIFWEEEIRPQKLNKDKRKLFQLLKKEKYSQQFDLFKPYQVQAWIKKRVHQENFEIEEAAAEHLAQVFNSDLWAIDNELNKLFAYLSPKKEIDLVAVKSLGTVLLNQNIWEMVDALGNKNRKLALRLLSDQLKGGADINQLMGMIVRQFRIITQVKIAQQKKRTASAKQLGLHPYVYRKASRQAQNYTLSQLKKIYRELLQADLLRKTQSLSLLALIDLLIVKI